MLRTVFSNATNILKTCVPVQQQTRNTFILKRRIEPPLYKQGYKPKKLRAKHFLYDLVEDKSVKKRPDLEVVLKTFVEGIGDKGDIVSLRPNFVYNKLLLPGLAVYKTEENIKRYAKTEKDKSHTVHSSPYAQRTVNLLERLVLGVVMNKDQPWKIEKWHIRASLRKAGYHVEDDCITLPEAAIEGPDLRKDGKEFFCTITVNNLEKARLRCRIRHWSTDPSERLPYVQDHWKLKAEPLFGSEIGAEKTDSPQEPVQPK